MIIFLSFCFACANVHGQKFPEPSLPMQENTFYTYLDNENIADPSRYNGNVKKVIRTFKEYQAGVAVIMLEKTTQFVNKKGELEKTVKRVYVFGVEDSKVETNHLETPEAIEETVGNQTIKIVKNKETDDFEYDYDQKGDDKYVYENDRLVAFYNNNDSISYNYDAKNRLVSVKYFESMLTEEYNDEDGTTTLWRSDFEDKALQLIRYENDVPVEKIVYDKYGEVIDIYKTTYTYSANNLLEKFQTVYKRYLFDYYDSSIAIEKQKYEDFPVVEPVESTQIGTFQYSDKNKIRSFSMKNGDEKEEYKITFDTNNRLHIVEGNLQFYKDEEIQNLQVEYEYVYDEKGNPSTIKSFYYIGGEKMLHKETLFEIEYY